MWVDLLSVPFDVHRTVRVPVIINVKFAGMHWPIESAASHGNDVDPGFTTGCANIVSPM